MTFYASTTRTTDDDHNTDERNTSLLQHQCDQNFLLRITEELKKSVNESLEGVVGDLREQVTNLQSEVVSLQQSSAAGISAVKRSRLPKVLTVTIYMCIYELIMNTILYRRLLRNFMKQQKIDLIQASRKMLL